MARINPAHIQCRIGLKITQTIGLGEHLVIAEARAFHAGQNVVAGAIHHTQNAGDFVAGQTLAKRFDHRDAACDRRFITDHTTFFVGGRGQCMPVDGQHRLVRCDNILAGRQRGLGGRFRRAISAPHQFNKHIHIVALGQCDRVIFPRIIGQSHATILGAVARANGSDFNLLTRAGGQFGPMALHHFDHARADCAQSSNSQSQRIRHSQLHLRNRVRRTV